MDSGFMFQIRWMQICNTIRASSVKNAKFCLKFKGMY